MKKLRSKAWYPYTVAICTGVILYVVLTHLPDLISYMKEFGRFFNTVVIGCVVAYLMNPLAMLYEKKLFRNLKKWKWTLSVFLAFATVAAIIIVLAFTLIPQLVNSIATFVANAPGYQKYIHSLFERLGATSLIYIPESANEVTNQAIDFLKGYGEDITAFMTDIVKLTANIAIAVVLAIYLLAAKSTFKRDIKTFLSAVLMDDKLNSVLSYVRKCNFILNRYLVFSLLDALIVGVVNAIIMLILRMPYAGMVSIIVGVTNLIPTFGPVIGAVFGGFILLLVDPLSAILYIVVNTVLQTCDGYIIKPKLFGNSLGVSGILILLAIVTLGNAFGIGGILLAIPVAAICDFSYREGVLPYLQARKAKKQADANHVQ